MPARGVPGARAGEQGGPIMSMRVRQKTHQHLYPNWKRKESPARQAKIRDGLVCVDCGMADRTLILDEDGKPAYMLYLHAAHLHPLDSDFQRVEPIDGQRTRARCPHHHRLYDLKWEAIELQLAEYREAHARIPAAWLTQRFVTVV
jgi:hypothetical protein